MKAQLASLASRINANREEMNAKMDATKENMDVWIAEMRDGRKKEMMTCQEMTETCLDSKEPNPEDMQSGVEHWEVPKEHTTVKPVRELKKRHRGRHLAAGRRRKPEEQTQRNCGSWRKLAAADRKLTCRAGVAWRKVHIIGKNHTRD
jgi:hypothetical protein